MDPPITAYCEDAYGPLPAEYRGVFGPMLFCNRQVLEQLDQQGFFALQPTNRGEANGCERLAGLMLERAGWDLRTVPVLQGVGGLMDDPNYSTEFVRKRFRARP
jgi:hypothetical protein